jgi:hypothetical protein
MFVESVASKLIFLSILLYHEKDLCGNCKLERRQVMKFELRFDSMKNQIFC